MNRNLCALVALVLAAGICTSGHAKSISPFVETELQSIDTCAGNFKVAAERVQKGQVQFEDAMATTVATPIVWNKFRGQRELFGYVPSFRPNRVSFAANGRPVIRDRELNLQVLMDDGRWTRIPLLQVVTESLRRQRLLSATNPWVPKYERGKLFDSGTHTEERVIFDGKCRAYTVVNANDSSLGQSFLLYSNDGGHSWAAYAVPKTNDPLYTVSLEAPVNGTLLQSPPALIVAEKYDPAAADGTYSSNAHRAWLLFPVLTPSGTLTLAGPFPISDHTLCCGNHSGFEAQAVSYRDHIHIAYPGDSAVADPITNRLGTPQYVRTFSRRLKRFINPPIFVGTGLLGPDHGAPDPTRNVPDSHSQTAVAIDRAGFIHIVIGGHGSRLTYRRSIQPDDASSWTRPEVFSLQPKVADRNDFVDEYTYPSLVLDRKGQPNVLARWSGESYKFRLIYTVRSNQTGIWTPQQELLDPGRAYYGVWYQKMTSDPWGRLFISYSYYPDNLFSDEAATLAAQYGFVLSIQPSTPPCELTKSTDPKPNYCHYLGYEDIGAAILMRRAVGEKFVLASTRDFFSF
jgi:BNR repeat-containing family member